MAGLDRWLLIEAGGHRLAVPARQVEAIQALGSAPVELTGRCAAEETFVALAGAFGGEEEGEGGVRICLRGGEVPASVRVRAADEMIQGPELVPLPLLLRRALGEQSPFLGAILWDGRPILAVDLHGCVSRCRG